MAPSSDEILCRDHPQAVLHLLLSRFPFLAFPLLVKLWAAPRGFPWSVKERYWDEPVDANLAASARTEIRQLERDGYLASYSATIPWPAPPRLSRSATLEASAEEIIYRHDLWKRLRPCELRLVVPTVKLFDRLSSDLPESAREELPLFHEALKNATPGYIAPRLYLASWSIRSGKSVKVIEDIRLTVADGLGYPHAYLKRNPRDVLRDYLFDEQGKEINQPGLSLPDFLTFPVIVPLVGSKGAIEALSEAAGDRVANVVLR